MGNVIKDVETFIADRFRAYGNLNTYWLNVDSERIELYCLIAESVYPKKEAQNLLNYSGDKSLEEYEKLKDNFIGSLRISDHGSGHVFGETRGFCLWALVDIDKRKRELMTKEKQDKLNSLIKEKEKIETELNGLLGDNKESK